jgi:hypothetical protein
MRRKDSFLRFGQPTHQVVHRVTEDVDEYGVTRGGMVFANGGAQLAQRVMQAAGAHVQ